jgi:hypothetical protein
MTTRYASLRSSIRRGLIVALLLLPILLPTSGQSRVGETLYNGIRLGSPWPPPLEEVPPQPVTPAYLTAPPDVIPIDVGRQLFVDDFLIEATTLRRRFHPAEYYPGNPVLRADRPWEQAGGSPTAMVFSDGVWYDPRDRQFKMWYMGGAGRSVCYATSTDGIHWVKPSLDVQPGTNIVLAGDRDSATVWLDQDEKQPGRRFKLFRSHNLGDHFGLSVYFSPDGIHWGERAFDTGSCGDRSTAFWNPFRKVWVYSLRHGWGEPRRRRYWETRDLLAGPRWTRIDEPPIWAGADRLDLPRADLNITPQLYNLDAVGYESLLLGLFTIWRGQPGDRPKPNDLVPGYSRDGWNWVRPSRQPFIRVSEHQGDWNWGNVQSAGGCCLIVGEKLYFYVSGRAGVPGTSGSGVCSTGLATLRRDGFVSMDADDGTLTTRPVRFRGRYLFVNAAVAKGDLRVAALDDAGREIAPFSEANCVPLHGDGTRQAVRWRGARDLSKLAARPVRFRFHLRNGELYAFWVSPEKTGASHGYVAAGGPGFTGPTDTVGSTAPTPTPTLTRRSTKTE